MRGHGGGGALSASHIRLTAYVIGEEIERRRRFGHPIPSALHDLASALDRAMSASGHESGATTLDPSRWKTSEQLATEQGCTARTARRRAAASGGRKIGGRWIFEEEP